MKRSLIAGESLDARIAYDTEAAVFVAYDPVFNVYSQGESELEAREALAGALRLRAKFVADRKLGS